MKSILAIIVSAICFAGISAAGQNYTQGQIFPTNSGTFVPAQNTTQKATLIVTIPAHSFTITTANLGATNCMQFYAYLNVFGTTNLVPLTIAAPTANTTNLAYNPSATNISETVTTLATNFTVNLQWLVNTTNQAFTNIQGTIFQNY